MWDLATGVLAAGLLASTALLTAAALRLRALVEFLLAAYLIAFAEAVLIVLLLTPFDAVERGALIVGLALAWLAAVGIWCRFGHPLPDLSPLGRLGHLLRTERVFWPLAGVLALALGYTAALVVATPPNNGDSLAYHLARAAFWRQEGHVGYISETYDERLNAIPPNAEIVLTLILEVTRSERAVGIVQFVSLLACACAVFALARRIGRSGKEAAFGAALFLSLPAVLLQASTTQNDLAVVAPLLAATVFLLGRRRSPDAVLASLAVAIAVGTKPLAAFALPLLVVVAVWAGPREHRVPRLLALAIGTAVGSYWYLVNLAEAGSVFGDAQEHRSTFLHLQENVLTALAFVWDMLDLSGSIDSDIFVYVLVGLVLAIVAAIVRRTDRSASVSLLGAGVIVAVVPFGVLLGSYVYWRAFVVVDDRLDAPDGNFPLARWFAPTDTSESFSWFGPVGLLAFAAAAAAIFLARRRRWPRLAVLFALAPLVWLVLVSATIAYDTSEGRYFIYPIALSASLWGAILHWRSIAWATSALAATTVALSLTHFLEKPSGLRLVDPDVPETIWGAERWRVHAVHRPKTPASALRFLATLPHDDSVALALGYNDFGYPAFGPRLERHVELVAEGSSARTSQADWLLANARRAEDIDRACWRPVLTSPEGWVGFQRLNACRT